MLIPRPDYMQKLQNFKDKDQAKVLTGVRRCGKSTIFTLFQEYLLGAGIAKNQIQNINLEDIDNEHLLDYKKLHEQVKNNLIPGKMNYIFLDEIQNVKDFEKVARSLLDKGNVDLYMTGSNSKMLSGEWATSLSGRYMEIPVFPLSFKEFVSYISKSVLGTPKSSLELSAQLPILYDCYTNFGSFPKQVVDFIVPSFKSSNKPSLATESAESLFGIYSTIVIKDITDRQRGKGEFISPPILENLIKFMAGNIGNLTSPNGIANAMTANKTPITQPTVESYLQAFCDSFILYKAGRFDIQGKKSLKLNDKYYLVDMGLRYLMVGNKQNADGHILENIVYLELLRRGYKVSVGKITKRTGGEMKTIEVDFVAQKPGGVVEYYQVAWNVSGNDDALSREYGALEEIKDNYPKYLLTMDQGHGGQDGIQRLNVLTWLMGDEIMDITK